MNEEELKAIARDAVMKTDEQYDYLPKRADAVAVFEPHRWVLMAMNSAHEQGYIKGMEMTRKLMRLRLGLGTREDEC